MTIGIRKVCSYLPKDAVSNYNQAQHLDATEDFIRDKIGMLHLTRKGPSEETSDMAMRAVLPVFEEENLTPEQVECLILVTQNPDGKGLPHTSAILHNKLNLPESCVVFDLSLGCSGFVHGLVVVKSFMEQLGLKNGLLVTSDPYSKVIDPNDRDTALLFGDGATATWLSDEFIWDIKESDFGTVSNRNDALRVTSEHCLTMNGRGVFNFAATHIPSSVERVLRKSGIIIDDVDLILLHQGSRYIVETLEKRIGVIGKAPFCAAEYGNTVSSSIPMMLSENVPDDAQRLILSGFGVGLAWATCLLERKNA